MFSTPEIYLNAEIDYRRERALAGRRSDFRPVKPKRDRKQRRGFVPQLRRTALLHG
jgi:hypothetical protein